MSTFEEQDAPYSRMMRAIVFADVCKSTRLFEEYGNARALQIVGHVLSVLSDLTVQYGGDVIKTIGDEVMSTFPDASAAAEAAGAMQQAVKDDSMLAQFGVCITIGLHFGEVLVEEGDVFGDAVNVAARMVGLAKADQVIATQATIERLPFKLRSSTRSLGQARVRGKVRPIEICEVLWRQDAGELTMVQAPSWEEVRQGGGGKLVVEYGNEVSVVESHGPSFQMGRGDGNDLIIQGQSVSRTHATIEFKKGYFILIDQSTNGTYLRIGEEEMFLHRDESRLLHEGVISLGEALSDGAANVIHYRYQD